MAFGTAPGGGGITPSPMTPSAGGMNTVGGNAPIPAAAPGNNIVVLQNSGMRAMSLGALQQREDDERAATEQRQNQPLITGLAGHIKGKFSVARDAKRFGDIEQRMLTNMRARRSVYDPQKLAAIQYEGGSEVYAGLTGQKCRGAAAWIRDVMMTTGEERPWSIKPTPLPELPPEINEMIVEAAKEPLKQQMMDAANGMGEPPDPMATVKMISMMKDQAMAAVREEASKRVERMATKMEDQMVEGGFLDALDEFINDLTTFPTAIIKGPVIRMKPYLTWAPNGDPVVENYGSAGLTMWLYDDSDIEEASGKPFTSLASNPDGTIDALQYWGSVQGQMLLDWGMTKRQIPEPTREYQVEAWSIGPYVIKATLNPDPLNRRPYYATSYERVPGSFWGNSVADLVKDPQDIVNAAARNMINNAALSSGPQVGILTDRIAPGEQITQIKPWRIWQLTSDPMGGSTSDPPIRFFQPQSTLPDLMALFDKFTALADEYSGIRAT